MTRVLLVLMLAPAAATAGPFWKKSPPADKADVKPASATIPAPDAMPSATAPPPAFVPPPPGPAPLAASSCPDGSCDRPPGGSHRGLFGGTWWYDHIRAPYGVPTPLGCGNLWTEYKFVFGSCRQYFGTGQASTGCGKATQGP